MAGSLRATPYDLQSLRTEVPSTRDPEPVLPSTSSFCVADSGAATSRDLELSLVWVFDPKPVVKLPFAHMLLEPHAVLAPPNIVLSEPPVPFLSVDFALLTSENESDYSEALVLPREPRDLSQLTGCLSVVCCALATP